MPNTKLKAGQLDLIYQDGFIRYIKLGDQEVLRMINHALRDHNWGTIPMQIVQEDIQSSEDSFLITYQSKFKQGSIDFDLSCRIEGKNDNTLTFHYEGTALNTFRRNRIGFTVLHPISSCAGKEVAIIHTDKKKTETIFPEWISPHQPFIDIKEMHWDLGKGVSASLDFEGEVFETEDQRNWTDASYKTYCTPLDLPFPVKVEKGDTIIQNISLKVNNNKNLDINQLSDDTVIITLNTEPLTAPAMGIETKVGNGFATSQVIKELNPDYVRIELALDFPYEPSLNLLKWAAAAGIPVELCLFTDQDDPINSLLNIKSYFKPVKYLLLFGENSKTTPKSLISLVPQLRDIFPGIEIYAGTDAFFTELNREPVNAETLDGVTYSINPQVHAFDNESLIETLEAQAYTVQTAHYLYPHKKIRISPITFHMRWNPNATDPDKDLRHPTGWTDPRQFQFFGACWYLISFKYLCEAGVDGTTYFRLMGDDGWLKTTEKSLQKSPIYALRQEIKNYKNILISHSSNPLLADAISFVLSDKILMMVVNWRNEKQALSLPEGFTPIRSCHGHNKIKGKLNWEDYQPLEKEGVFSIAPNSLTVFEKAV